MTKPKKIKDKREAESFPKINPICDVTASPNRKPLMLSPKDIEILRQLKQNPPQPTSKLITLLQQSTHKEGNLG